MLNAAQAKCNLKLPHHAPLSSSNALKLVSNRTKAKTNSLQRKLKNKNKSLIDLHHFENINVQLKQFVKFRHLKFEKNEGYHCFNRSLVHLSDDITQ